MADAGTQRVVGPHHQRVLAAGGERLDVVTQVRRLVERGHREVVLTGVDLTSYRPSLGALVKARQPLIRPIERAFARPT